MSSRTSRTRIEPCPPRPSCVCSADARPRHHVAPLELAAPPDGRFAAIRDLILDQPRVELIEEGPDHLHFVFRSRLFRFQDDVELYRAAGSDVVDVRSCSRLGYYDFGVNRRRVENLRRRLRAAGLVK